MPSGIGSLVCLSSHPVLGRKGPHPEGPGPYLILRDHPPTDTHTYPPRSLRNWISLFLYLCRPWEWRWENMFLWPPIPTWRNRAHFPGAYHIHLWPKNGGVEGDWYVRFHVPIEFFSLYLLSRIQMFTDLLELCCLIWQLLAACDDLHFS